MEFLITSYIYPLKDMILLSPYFGFSLDNPRTEVENEVVKGYLLRAYESGYDYKFPIQSDEPVVTIESVLSDFNKTFATLDSHVAETFKDYTRENVFDFLASIWVIARFDDKGIGEELRQEYRQMQAEGQAGIFILEDEHPLVQKPKTLASYCFLLSLLCHTERDSYFGRAFLVDPHSLAPDRPVERVWREFMMFCFVYIDSLY